MHLALIIYLLIGENELSAEILRLEEKRNQLDAELQKVNFFMYLLLYYCNNFCK
jgi:hypothetical protein